MYASVAEVLNVYSTGRLSAENAEKALYRLMLRHPLRLLRSLPDERRTHEICIKRASELPQAALLNR